MVSPAHKQRAGIKANGDFISIRAYSGYVLSLADPVFEEALLAADADEGLLGSAVLQALSHSRFLTLPESEELRAAAAAHYEEWVANLLGRFGYRSRRALFKNMRSCSVESDGGRITIQPTRHQQLEGWGRSKHDAIEDVVLDAPRSAAEVGAAVRLALARCIG